MCFLSEAVEWVAFGRVPQIDHYEDSHSDGLVDYRFYWREMPDNFEPSFKFPWFDLLEFESLGVPFVDGYFEAAEKCAFENVRGLPQQIAEYEAREPTIIKDEDGNLYNFWAKEADKCRVKLEELVPLQKVVDESEAGFKPHFDVACAKLFQLLAMGDLASEAINEARWTRLADEEKYEEAALFESIPASAFTLGFDWRSNRISVGDETFVALRLNVEEILIHRSFLMKPGQIVSVERVGAFYATSNGPNTNLRPSRGRKPVVDWAEVKAYLFSLEANGELPEGKESCIYELISFVERTLGKAPSRSAIQRNMSMELDAHYASK